jgi:uroporphyrinogen decarboxylase
MRQAGRYLPEYRAVRAKAGGFVELCLNPYLAAEVTLQPIRRFALDAAIIFSDILLVPYALGVPLWFEKAEGPRLQPVGAANLAELRRELDISIVGRLYEAVGHVREELSPEVALIGFAGAPWTVATYLAAGRGGDDQKAAKSFLRDDPSAFDELMEVLVKSTAAHLIGQLRAGADLVQVFDTWAGVLEGPNFERWCVDPTARIVKAVRAEIPDARVIVFPRGVTLEGIEQLVAACGPDAVSISVDTPRKAIRERLGGRCALQGNLSPETLVGGGDKLDREVDQILDDFRGARHVFNLGHGILKDTPIDHVEQMISRVRRAR